MSTLSKSTRELYANIHAELTYLYYRRLLIKQLFTSKDTNDLLNKAAIRFFTTLKWDLLNTIAIGISRLTDPAKSFNTFNNASLKRLVDSLNSTDYPELVDSLNDIHKQIKSKSGRVENWRKKWAAHRDLDVVEGATSKPAMSMPEVDELLALIGNFLNEFERVFQDTQVEINLYDNPLTFEELDEMDRLKIHAPASYEDIHFLPDDGNTIIELIKKANSLGY